MRANKDNLSSDALDKRLRFMIKTPLDVHSHACHFDIHMNGVGTVVSLLSNHHFLFMPVNLSKDFILCTQLEALEEKILGT
jgi:hypothetical protein